jgi:hypothetical protein
MSLTGFTPLQFVLAAFIAYVCGATFIWTLLQRRVNSISDSIIGP